MNRTHQNRFRVRSKLGGSLLLLAALFFAALLSFGGHGFLAQAQSAATVLDVSTGGTDPETCPDLRNTVTYRTIKRALECASPTYKDTIRIAAGKYAESNLEVTKSVIIQGGLGTPPATPGAGSGAILVPSETDTVDNPATAFGGTPLQGFIIKSNNVTISNLTIDGDPNTTNTNNLRIGIATPDETTATATAYSGLVVENVTIQNVNYAGVRLFTKGTDNRISKNIISDVRQKCAVTLLQKDTVDGAAEISGNSIDTAHCGISTNDDTNTTTLSTLTSVKLTAKANTITLLGANTTIGTTSVSGGAEKGMNLVGLADGSLIGGTSISDRNTITTGGYYDNPATSILTAGNLGVGIVIKGAKGEATIQQNFINAKNADAAIWVYGSGTTTSGTTTKRVIVDGNTLTASTGNIVNLNRGEATGIFVTDNKTIASNVSPVPTNDESSASYLTIKKNQIKGFIRGIELFRNANTATAGGSILNALIGGAFDGSGAKADANTIDGTGIPAAETDAIAIRLHDENESANNHKTQAKLNFNTIQSYNFATATSGKGLEVNNSVALVQNTFFTGNFKDVLVAGTDGLVDLGDVGVDRNTSFSVTIPNKPGYTGLGQSVGCNVFKGTASIDSATTNTDAENNWITVASTTLVDASPVNPVTTPPASLADIPATCNMVGGFVWQDDNGNSVADTGEKWGTVAAAANVGETWDDSTGTTTGFWDTAELWLDTTTANGIRNQVNTKGVTGVDVKLFKSDGTTMLKCDGTTTTTAAEQCTKTSNYGYYFFPNLPDGDYLAKFDLVTYASRTSKCTAVGTLVCDPSPPSYTFTPKTGESKAYDSATNATKEGLTEAFTLKGSATNSTISAGLLPRTTIKGTVWYDDNNNSANDTENGIPGVTVKLLKASDPTGLAVQTVTTAVAPTSPATSPAAGEYTFSGVPYGNYIVEVVRPAGTTGLPIPNTGTAPATGYIFSNKSYLAATETGYSAGAELKSAASPTTDNSAGRTAAINASTSVEVRNIGLRAAGQVKGTVWVDNGAGGGTANDGTKNNDTEAGKSGITVELRDGTGNSFSPKKTVTTATAGAYTFNELIPGDYTVFVDPAQAVLHGTEGYAFTTPFVGATTPNTPAPDASGNTAGKSYVFNTGLTEGQTQKFSIADDPDTAIDPTKSFANVDVGLQEINIGDKVFVFSGTGTPTGNEAGVGGVVVTLYSVTSCAPPALTGCTAYATPPSPDTTDINGLYNFSGVTAGDYYVQFKMPSADYIFSYPSASAVIKDPKDATLAYIKVTGAGPGVFKLDTDLGVYRKNTVSGRVWDDTVDQGGVAAYAGDGVWKNGEEGKSGVTVKLWQKDNTTDKFIVKDTQLTQTNGSYEFTNVETGAYTIGVTLPNGYGLTKKYKDSTTANGDTNIDDSDFNNDPGDKSTFGETDEFSLSTDSTKRRDAGIYKLGSIGNLVWEDYDSTDSTKSFDGLQSGSEANLANVTVTLKLDGSKLPAVITTTDKFGNYHFPNLVRGTYKINFTVAKGYTYTQKTGNLDDINNSDVDSKFGEASVTLNVNQNTDNVDAGMYKVAIVRGSIWEDTNGNGLYDAGELGRMSGVKDIELVDANGASLDPAIKAITDNTGVYTLTPTFGKPGKYKVKVTLQSDYSFTPDKTKDSDFDSKDGLTDLIDLPYGKTEIRDAGIYKKIKVETRVWEDANADGFQGPDELGYKGAIKVNLLSCVATLCTDTGKIPTNGVGIATGIYTFTDLNPGGYKLQYTLPAKYNFSMKDAGLASGTNNDTVDSDVFTTTSETAVFTTTSGETESDMDVGLYQNVTLGDRVWEDVNANGIQDPNETKGVMATVKLYPKGTSTAINMSSTSPITGLYRLQNVQPGDYSLCVEDLPTGYKLSPADVGTDSAKDSDVDSKGCVSIALLSGESADAFEWDVGVYKPGVIGDFVWEDLNADGIQDAGEKGIREVSVKLYRRDATGKDQVVNATSTNSTGAYSFTVDPATYTVEFGLPTGFSFSPLGKGTSTTDSDASLTTGRTNPIIVTSGSIINTFWDAGMYRSGTVGNFIWEDLNANGLQDPGEAGIAGVNVSLLSDSTVVTKTVSDLKGLYSLSAKPGSYTVAVNAPLGYAFSPTFKGTIDNDSNFVTSATNPFSATASVILKSGIVTDTVDAGLVFAEVLINGSSDVTPTLSVAEGGKTDSYKVRLSAPPSGSVAVKAIDGSKQLTLTPALLTFDATNWSQDQTVSVVAVDDRYPESLLTALITHTVTSSDLNYNNLVPANVKVEVTDNDKPAEVLINGSSNVIPTLSVAEGGKTDSYKVRLSVQPISSVEVKVNDSSKQLTLTPTTLTFDATNWNQDQTVSVVALDDKKPESLLTTLLTHTVTSSDILYNNLVPANVKVEVTDNDKPVAYLLQSAASTIVGEGILDKGGFNDTYAIQLQVAPTADVLITLTPLDSQITVTPTQLTFTPSNWAKQQVVMVSAVDDSVIEGLHNSAILHTVTSSDAIFNGGYIQEPSFNTYADGNPLPVFIEDNDTKVNISPLKLHLAEGGASKTYQVSLSGSPTADVTIVPFPFDQLGIVQSTGQITFTPSSLTFSPGNASISQTVTVSALDNSIMEGTHAAAIFHKVVPTSAADQDFMGTTGVANGVYLLIDDNDSLVEISPTSLELAEGGPAKTYQVQLKSNEVYGPPTKNVVVSILTDGQVTLNPTKLTFTPENYGTPQTVTIAAVDDTLLEGWHEGTAFSWLTSEDSDYVQSRASLVVATIKDNDNSPDLQLAKSDGGLKAQPGRPITYTLTYTNAGHMDASGTVITEKVPAYTSFSSSGSSTGWSCENAGVAGSACSYRLGILPVKGQGKLTFTVLVTSTLPDSALYITNTANITSDAEIDGNLVDNTASLTSTISQLRILVTDEGQSVKPGGVLRYTIHYTNTGSGIAQNVNIKIFVPANATFNSSQSGPGLAALPGVWEHADGTPCANGDPAGTTCIYLVPPKGSLGPGQSGIVYFAVTVNSTLPTGVNKITIEAEISDDTTSNKGSSEDETTIQAAPVALNVYLPFIAKNIPYTPPSTPTPAPALTPTPAPTTVVENPDLVVSSVSLNPAKQTFSAGEAVEISVVVTNQGKGVAAPFWVDLYLNPNTPPTTANVRWNQTCGTSNVSYCFGLAWQISQTLQAGQSVTLKSLATGNGHFDIDSSRWQGWFANGTTDLYVYADSWNPTVVYGANQEADETNNRAEIRNLVVTGTNPPAGGGSAISTTAPR